MVTHEICVKLKTGSSLVRFKPVFSYDSRFFLVACDKTVKVFSCASGECILVFKKHKALVHSVVINPSNHVQVLSCSEDGVIFKWDPSDGSVLKKWSISNFVPVKIGNLLSFFVLASEFQWLVVAEKGNNSYIITIDANKEKFKLSSTANSKLISVGAEGSYVVAASTKSISVYQVSKFPRITECTETSVKKDKITCLVCHPKENIFATGHASGRILVWCNIFESSSIRHSSYHWHTLPVADLAFSSEGSYLYSGGQENVLVKWMLNTEDKQFLPRLGFPIKFIATSNYNKHVLISHADNGLFLINPQNQIVQIVQGLTKVQNISGSEPGKEYKFLPAGLHVDPRSKALVLNGRPGHLQFYSLREDKQLFDLDIAGKDILSQERSFDVINTEIICADYDEHGNWLATVEYWSDNITSPEISLKFWKFDTSLQNFSMATNVYLPHSQKVNDIKFRPVKTPDVDLLLATTGRDKKFKLWSLFQEEGLKRDAWNCLSVACYRNRVPEKLSFSEDGTLLAVTFDHAITLWIPDSNTLCATLSLPESSETVTAVNFGRGYCANLIVSLTSDELVVWDVLSLSAVWKKSVRLSCLLSDPKSDIMAAFTAENSLIIFSPKQSDFLYTYKNVCKGPVIAAVFVPSTSPGPLFWQKQSQLYFMNFEQELLCLDTLESQEEDNMKFKEIIPATPFSSLIAEKSKSDVRGTVSSLHMQQGVTGKKEIRQLLEISSYALPPMSSLCKDFITSLLIKSPEKATKQDQDREESLDAASGSESEMELDDDSMYKMSSRESESAENKKNEHHKNKSLSRILKEDFSWVKESFKSSSTSGAKQNTSEDDS